MEDKIPDYMYRPNDYSIFNRVDDIHFKHSMNVNIENHVGHKYTYEVLKSHGFKPCDESEFKDLEAKHELYLAYNSWASRPDGHGGCKGGTIEEYLEIIKYKNA